MTDWHFSKDASICLCRTAGVLLRNNKLFVQSDNGVYALPGGHIQIGETSEETLIREYLEETGAKILCNRLLWVEESFWKWENKAAHGIIFYYLVSLEDGADIPDDCFTSQKDNCDITLEWVPLDKIKDLPIYPAFVKEKIHHLPEHIEHIISYE